MARLACVIAAIIVALAGGADGAALAVKNPSFESPALADDSRSASIPGWTVDNQLGGGTVRVFNPTNAQYTGATDPGGSTHGPLPGPAAGGQVAAFEFSSLTGQESASQLSQGITNPDGSALLIQRYTLYTVTVAAGRRLNEFPMNYGISFQPTAQGNGAALMVFDGTLLNPGTFLDHSLSWFPARVQIGLPLRIGISGGSGTISGIRGVDLDNVRLDARPVLPGDSNVDGHVNFTDLLALAQNYGHGGAQWSQGDFDYDGNVGFTDLLLLAQHYGAAAPQSAASPNPSPPGCCSCPCSSCVGAVDFLLIVR